MNRQRLTAATIFTCPHCRSLVTIPDPRPDYDTLVTCDCPEPTEVRYVIQYWSYLRLSTPAVAVDLLRLYPRPPDFRVWWLN